jgi:HEAT repeat protein
MELDPARTVRRAAAFSLAVLGELTAVPLAIMFIGDKGIVEKDIRPVLNRLHEITGIGTTEWVARDWMVWWVTKGGWGWLESKGVDIARAKRIMNAQRKSGYNPEEDAASSLETDDTETLLKFLRHLSSKEGRNQLDNPKIFNKVLEIGKSTRDAVVALNVVWILREIEDPDLREKSKAVLVEMLSRKENRIAYENIIKLLSEWKVKEAVEPLVYLVEDEKYGDQAVAALEAITGKKLGSKKRVDWENLLAGHNTNIKADFLKRLKESEGKELLQALSDLGSSRYKRLWLDPEIYKTLLEISDKVSTWEQVSAYVPVLTRNDTDPATQKTLIKMTERLQDLQVKKFLLETLANHFSNGMTIDFLLDFLEKGERRLRMSVRDLLYDITGASAAERLRTKSDWLEYFSKHPAARWGKKK